VLARCGTAGGANFISTFSFPGRNNQRWLLVDADRQPICLAVNSSFEPFVTLDFYLRRKFAVPDQWNARPFDFQIGRCSIDHRERHLSRPVKIYCVVAAAIGRLIVLNKPASEVWTIGGVDGFHDQINQRGSDVGVLDRMEQDRDDTVTLFKRAAFHRDATWQTLRSQLQRFFVWGVTAVPPADLEGRENQ
jgi:hypothetical protein